MRALILLAVFLVGCVPASPGVQVTAPVQAEGVALFDALCGAADGGGFDLRLNPCEIETKDGVTLVVQEKTTASFERVDGGLKISFEQPYPRGKKRFGPVNIAAGVHTLLVERDTITAITDKFGKRFVWKLVEQ